MAIKDSMFLKKIKTIFLDLDGVLNGNLTTWEGFPHSHINPVLVNRLNIIIQGTGAKVVISSSWRFKFEYPELESILKDQGFVGEVIGQTPKFSKRVRGMDRMARGYEIQEWLDDCKYDVEKFIILDDISNMVHLKKRLILTNAKMGLAFRDVERAIRMLNE